MLARLLAQYAQLKTSVPEVVNIFFNPALQNLLLLGGSERVLQNYQFSSSIYNFKLTNSGQNNYFNYMLKAR